MGRFRHIAEGLDDMKFRKKPNREEWVGRSLPLQRIQRQYAEGSDRHSNGTLRPLRNKIKQHK